MFDSMQAQLYSGTGNLLWVVEVAPGTPVFSGRTWVDLAIDLCREQGDGLMVVTQTAPYVASFINPDGSDGLFCGNGVRCVAYHLARKYQLASPFTVRIADLDIVCQVNEDVVGIELPKLGVQSLGEFSLQVFDDLSLQGLRMNMPNPHWVIFQELGLFELERIGARVNELISGGMNVEFVFQDILGVWQVLVYERGAGITEACGSGALAVLCVLQEQGFIGRGQKLALNMLGGVLNLQDLGERLFLEGRVELLIKDK